MTSAEEVLHAAKNVYARATEKYFDARRSGDIVEDPDPTSGRRWMPATPRGGMILGIWQKAKAELDAAADNRRRELGQAACSTCDHTEARMSRLPTAEQLADMRLPPEAR
jgi:hypothetical protein